MIAEVRLWGRTIGAVSTVPGSAHAAFQYDAPFVHSGIQVAPLMMPLSSVVYTFPELSIAAFHGLPGLVSDSLPDKFGNALIDAWLATQGRLASSFNAVERLCYTGARGMGALEFRPVLGPRARTTAEIDIDALVKLASEILSARARFKASFAGPARQHALKEILSVSTSAGGARAKAVIAWNRKTHEVRSGQLPVDPGFEHWLIKFDGVSANRDRELADPMGFGAVEYAYYLMAKAAGITMSECRLLEENGRRHFMTRRFDRVKGGAKRHLQSLGALAHFDYNIPGAYAYEQAFLVMHQLKLSPVAIEQQFRRMAFNVIARNQDDHVKNIAFLMDPAGRWSLAPAYDVTYAFNPTGAFTSMHQMSVNGRRDNFTLADFRACAKTAIMKRGRAEAIIREVTTVVKRWKAFATKAKVDRDWAAAIGNAHRLEVS